MKLILNPSPNFLIPLIKEGISTLIIDNQKKILCIFLACVIPIIYFIVRNWEEIKKLNKDNDPHAKKIDNLKENILPNAQMAERAKLDQDLSKFNIDLENLKLEKMKLQKDQEELQKNQEELRQEKNQVEALRDRLEKQENLRKATGHIDANTVADVEQFLLWAEDLDEKEAAARKKSKPLHEINPISKKTIPLTKITPQPIIDPTKKPFMLAKQGRIKDYLKKHFRTKEILEYYRKMAAESFAGKVIPKNDLEQLKKLLDIAFNSQKFGMDDIMYQNTLGEIGQALIDFENQLTIEDAENKFFKQMDQKEKNQNTPQNAKPKLHDPIILSPIAPNLILNLNQGPIQTAINKPPVQQVKDGEDKKQGETQKQVAKIEDLDNKPEDDAIEEEVPKQEEDPKKQEKKVV